MIDGPVFNRRNQAIEPPTRSILCPPFTGEIGNRDAVHASGGSFAIGALDNQVEYGGFTLALEDKALVSCLDDKIGYLTDSLSIGYAEWLEDPSVFMRRARMWTEREPG